MKIALFYGGKSVEHEVSIISALNCLVHLSCKHDVILVYIDKNNKMILDNNLSDLKYYKNYQYNSKKEVYLSNNQDGPNLFYKTKPKRKVTFDIGFSCVHGLGVEDGTLSSLFSFYNIPYVGPSILESSVSMDKYICKELLKNKKIPVIKSVKINDESELIKLDLNYPVIVKPNRLGSSIGVSKADNIEEVKKSLNSIIMYDDFALVERFITNKIEYFVALFKDDNKLIFSNIEEVKSDNAFSYNDKYLKENVQRDICKNMEKHLYDKIIKTSEFIYTFLNCKSLIRIDYIYDLDSKKLYFNEVNVIPGSYALNLFENKDFFELLIRSNLNQFKNDLLKMKTIDNKELIDNNFNFK